MARPIVMRSGVWCARYEWQNPPFKRWSQTCNMMCRLEYSIWLCALRARMPPGYIYRHKIQVLISIWQTIYGVVSVYENRFIAEETINDPQNDTASLSPFLQYISYTQNKFFRFLQPIKPSNKQHVEYSNEIYVFDYRRREKFALH